MKSPVASPASQLLPGKALTFANVSEGAEGLIVADLARAVAAKPKPPAVEMPQPAPSVATPPIAMVSAPIELSRYKATFVRSKT